MAEEFSAAGNAIDSLNEVAVGDGLYSEAVDAPYWVAQISESRVVLLDTDGTPETWVRETFEASLAARPWIHQSRSCSRYDRPPFGRDTGPDDH